ncbi:endonuclease domain-containing protein [Tardiphaga sp. 768_D3_N2_1]|uniref:endonuclease domain-containing protein n=1 Tax=Tardiphaga sp. 768_D3_N2_1 TaxID=3240783 RepID=UPI003F8B5053
MDKFKARAKQLRTTQTSAEAKLWQALRARQLARWKFRRQHVINGFIVDFVTLDGRLVIEVDGVTHATAREAAYDARRTWVLESAGFLVLRFSNTDVYEDLEGVLKVIATTLPATE